MPKKSKVILTSEVKSQVLRAIESTVWDKQFIRSELRRWEFSDLKLFNRSSLAEFAFAKGTTERGRLEQIKSYAGNELKIRYKHGTAKRKSNAKSGQSVSTARMTEQQIQMDLFRRSRKKSRLKTGASKNAQHGSEKPKTPWLRRSSKTLPLVKPLSNQAPNEIPLSNCQHCAKYLTAVCYAKTKVDSDRVPSRAKKLCPACFNEIRPSEKRNYRAFSYSCSSPHAISGHSRKA